jgi:hypothetical protein
MVESNVAGNLCKPFMENFSQTLEVVLEMKYKQG